MLVSQGITVCMEYHRAHSKPHTLKSYEYILRKFQEQFQDRDIKSLSSEEVLAFLNLVCNGTRQGTKSSRFAYLRSFFNFIRNNIDHEFQNPCDAPMFKRIFRPAEATPWNILDKDIVDELIFRTTNQRNRLMLELMARGGMRISEVLKLTPSDIIDQKLILRDPKSGKEQEAVYIPQKIAERLKKYIKLREIGADKRIFPIKYVAAHAMVQRAGKMVGVALKPHDLRRYAATYASRSGVPIEIVSKVILRHANLSTTQRYLGKVSDKEASRWIDNLYC
jgi:integrase/recombinase XerD